MVIKRVLPVVLVIAVLCGTAGLGTAASEASPGIERSADDLVFEFECSAFDNPQNETIEFEVAEYTGSIEPSVDGDACTVQYPVADIASDVQITDERVTVNITEPQEHEERVDIRFVEFDGEVTHDAHYYDFHATTAGFENDEPLPAALITDEHERDLNSTAVIDGSREFVRIDPEEADDPALFGEEVELAVQAPDGVVSARSEPVDLISVAEPEFVVREELQLVHPLIFGNEQYVVNAETEGPDGTFATIATGSRTESGGHLQLPLSVALADSTTATVSYNGTELVENRSVPGDLLSPQVSNATASSGDVVQIPEGAEPNGAVERVFLFEDGAVVETDDVQYFDGELMFDDYEFAADGTYRMLVVTDSAIEHYEVTVTFEPLSENPILLLVGAFVFAPVGVIFAHAALRRSPSRMVDAIITIAVVIAAGGGVVLFRVDQRVAILAVIFAGGLVTAYGLRASPAGARRYLGGGLTAIGSLTVLLLVVWFVHEVPVWQAVPIFALGVVGQGVLAAVGSKGYGPFSTGDTTPKHTVTVTAVDRPTGDPIPVAWNITAEPANGHGGLKDSFTLEDGKGSTTLEEGRWHLMVADDKRMSVTIEVDEPVDKSIHVSRKEVPIFVGFPDGDPVDDATVSADLQHAVDHCKTESSGTTTIEIPEGYDSVPIKVDRDYVRPVTTTIQADRSRSSVTVEPKSGKLTARVTLERESPEDVPIKLTAESGPDNGNTLTGKTDEDGIVRFDGQRTRSEVDGLFVGEYRIRADLDGLGTNFTADARRIRLRDGDDKTVEIEIAFEFDLSPTTRDKIRNLERQITDLKKGSQRDTAIPAYFGSVVETAINLVKETPASGYHFFHKSADPDEVVDQMLAVADESLTHVNAAMSDTQCVDLFAACVEMPPADIDWSGSMTVERFLKLHELNSEDRMKVIADRRDRSKDRITEELGSLAEVAPAEAMVKETTALVRNNRTEPRTTHTAVVLVASSFYDATNDMFDELQLRERMSQTVF